MNYLSLYNVASKKQPIDPICAMCRIICLNFKSVKTKIGINGHAINLQDPVGIQSWMRLYYGDSREGIYELFNLVVHIIAWFLVPVEQMPSDDDNTALLDYTAKRPIIRKPDEKFVEELKKMIPYMCRGLERLQETYKTGNVVLTLQYYINLLRDGVDGKFDINTSIPKVLLEEIWFQPNLRNKVVASWSHTKLDCVYELFETCFKLLTENPVDKDEAINGYMIAIDHLLTNYEKTFNQQLKQWGINY